MRTPSPVRRLPYGAVPAIRPRPADRSNVRRPRQDLRDSRTVRDMVGPAFDAGSTRVVLESGLTRDGTVMGSRFGETIRARNQPITDSRRCAASGTVYYVTRTTTRIRNRANVGKGPGGRHSAAVRVRFAGRLARRREGVAGRRIGGGGQTLRNARRRNLLLRNKGRRDGHSTAGESRRIATPRRPNPMRSLWVVAGPNGCGKSTLTAARAFRAHSIIDPDEIARRLGDTAAVGRDVAAAREALRQRRAAVRSKQSLVLETTLSGHGVVRFIRETRDAGYQIQLHYVCLTSPELALLRIANRVARGGHGIPEADARRRFRRSLINLPRVIRLSNATVLYDNTLQDRPHRVVAAVDERRTWIVDDSPSWAFGAFRAAGAVV